MDALTHPHMHTHTQKKNKGTFLSLIVDFLQRALPKLMCSSLPKKSRGDKPVLAGSAVSRTPVVPLTTKHVSGRKICSDFTFGTIPAVLMTVCIEVFSLADLCFAKAPGTPVFFQVRWGSADNRLWPHTCNPGCETVPELPLASSVAVDVEENPPKLYHWSYRKWCLNCSTVSNNFP